MQLLNGTSQTLSFITGYAVDTTVIVDYIEVGHSTFVPKSKTVNINSATITEILQGIDTDTIQVKSITVHNNGDSLQQVQLVKNSTKITKVFKLEPDNVLRFDENGWPNREVGTVIEVTGTGEVNGLTLTGNVDSKGSLTLGGTLLVSGEDFINQPANLVFASPNGASGKPLFRALSADDLPDLPYIPNDGTGNQANWDIAYTDRFKWDGGSSGLTASTGRTSLGATTVGGNLFTLTNPGAESFIRINANNTVSTRSAAEFMGDLGANVKMELKESTGFNKREALMVNGAEWGNIPTHYWNGSDWVVIASSTFFGKKSGENNTGSYVTANGYYTAYNNTGSSVTANGYASAYNNTGSYVTASGRASAYNNTGSYVTASGDQSAYNNTGSFVTTNGYISALNNTGSSVTASGYYTLKLPLINPSKIKTCSPSDINTTTKQINIPSHGFGPNDTWTVLKYSVSGTAIGGLSNNEYYQVYIVDANTIAFKHPTTGREPRIITSQGSGTHTFSGLIDPSGSSIYGSYLEPDGQNQILLGAGQSTTTNANLRMKFDGTDWNVTSGKFIIPNTTESTSTTTGALQVKGGVGIEKNLHVGGTLYTPTGGVSTSDVNLKDEIDNLSGTEIRVAKRCLAAIKKFKFKDSIQSKGSNNARIHIGLIAQEVYQAFEYEGLDAAAYGIWCKDVWYTNGNIIFQENQIDEDGLGIVITEVEDTPGRMELIVFEEGYEPQPGEETEKWIEPVMKEVITKVPVERHEKQALRYDELNLFLIAALYNQD